MHGKSIHSIGLILFKTIGFLFIIFSVFNPWFSLPEITQVDSYIDFSNIEPNSSKIYRALSLIILIALFYAFLKKNTVLLIKTLSLYLFLVFLFPFFTINFSADIASRATSLNLQHRNISWLGGDIFTTQEYSKFSSRRRLQIIEPAKEIETFRLPYLNSNLLSVNVIRELVEWLGYSSVFCQFFSKGYVLSVLGSFILLFSFLRAGKDSQEAFDLVGFDLSLARKATFLILTPILVSVLLVFTLVLYSSFLISSSQDLTANLKFNKASVSLKKAEKIFPLLAHNTTHVYQKDYLNSFFANEKVSSEETNLYQIIQMDREGLSDRALALSLEQLSSEQSSIKKRETLRFILRKAIIKYNSGNTTEAKKLFDLILQKDPINIKANFVSQLIALEFEQVDKLKKLIKQLEFIYSKMNTRGSKPVLAFCRENLAIALLNQKRLEEGVSTWKERMR